MKTLAIYISNYNVIGGVERFVENFCKRMSKNYDITFFYDWCENENMLLEISEFVDVIKIDKTKKYNFDYFVNSTAWGFEPYNNILAKKVVQVVHADYRHVIANWNFKYNKHKNTTHHVCVGEIVKEAFEIATPYKCDAVIYNLLDNTIKLEPKQKSDILHLVTLSRLSGEKGFKRMLQMCEQMKNIDYIWNIYGSTQSAFAKQVVATFKNTKVQFKGVTREPFKEINKADYLVQLSDTEGFAYSVYEAMQVKTPCIITPFASGKEQIENGKNGWIVPFDMDNIQWDDILKRNLVVPEFEELGKEEDWIKLLENGKT